MRFWWFNLGVRWFRTHSSSRNVKYISLTSIENRLKTNLSILDKKKMSLDAQCHLYLSLNRYDAAEC